MKCTPASSPPCETSTSTNAGDEMKAVSAFAATVASAAVETRSSKSTASVRRRPREVMVTSDAAHSPLHSGPAALATTALKLVCASASNCTAVIPSNVTPPFTVNMSDGCALEPEPAVRRRAVQSTSVSDSWTFHSLSNSSRGSTDECAGLCTRMVYGFGNVSNVISEPNKTFSRSSKDNPIKLREGHQ